MAVGGTLFMRGGCKLPRQLAWGADVKMGRGGRGTSAGCHRGLRSWAAARVLRAGTMGAAMSTLRPYDGSESRVGSVEPRAHGWVGTRGWSSGG